MEIREKITLLRKEKGLSQNQLAKKAGIGQTTLNNIELGNKKTPTADTLQKIATALGVSMAEFDDNKIGNLMEQVLEKMETMELSEEEKAAHDKIKKMSLNEQQISFLKTVEKFKSLPASDQEALSKIIDSLAASQK